jgi:hypothetical protein
MISLKVMSIAVMHLENGLKRSLCESEKYDLACSVD